VILLKWKNHRLVSFALVFAGTGHLLPAFVAMRGSTFPDQIEESFLSPTWAKNHRKGTHYWVYYMVPIFLCAASVGHFLLYLPKEVIVTDLTTEPQEFLIRLVVYLGMWFCIGALLHVVEDFICGKVPGLTIEQRIGFHLFRVGTPQEYLWSYLIIASVIFSRFYSDVIFVYGL